jgi:hypothetical protein
VRRLRPDALNLVAAAAAATVACAFLPWASVVGDETRGIETDGRLTLAAGVAGLALLAVRRIIWVAVGELALGALVAVVALRSRTDYAGPGVPLTLLAGLIWAGASAWAIRTRHTA